MSKSAPALEVYAASLAETYGQEEVPFVYAGPAASLVEGIGTPRIEGSPSVELRQWTRSLEAIATQLGELGAERIR